MPQMIKDLMGLGYSKEEAKNLYNFYSNNDNLKELQKHIRQKQEYKQNKEECFALSY